RSLLVDLLRVKNPFADDLDGVAVHAAEETTRIPLVTGRPTDLLDLQQHGVGIAIDVHFTHLLHIAALLALSPESAPAAAVVASPSGAQGLLVGLAVHPGEHEYLATVGVLCNDGLQAADLVEINHHLSSVVCLRG